MCPFPQNHVADLSPSEGRPRPPLAIARGRRYRHPVGILLLALVLGALPSLMPNARVAASSASVLAHQGYADSMLALMDQERVAAGLPSLAFCTERSDVAAVRALDMAARSYFAHFNEEGVGAEQLLRDYPVDFRLAGENIARADFPPDQVVGIVHGALMASQHHRDNVLDARFRQVGVAVAFADNTYYFAVIFTD